MPAHDGEFGLESVNAVLWSVGSCFGEVAIENIPFVPLDPATGLEHPKEVVEEGCWFIVLDHADEVANVDDVVLCNEFLGWLVEDVDEAQGDLEDTNQHLIPAFLWRLSHSHYWAATPVAGIDRS